MYELELHKIMQAELVRRADHQRLVREARGARRSARGSAHQDGERPVSTAGAWERFTHAA
ncbi:hypothetical protein P8A18_24690 [Streptomyces castrisilvae]|uniref:Uncharacterized protein n=1 Tax=Streptomyces castrisilvae TaxID=3033811 RepID=A0ABY9HPH0_9ACTN|nr:hypothetical protein [Streptomyces sp. Mut1]WLQ36430.1 hypothetical protein P8A18_24690 [Streptomyces sp. Mut1]